MTEARDAIWLGGPVEDRAGPVGHIRAAAVDAARAAVTTGLAI